MTYEEITAMIDAIGIPAAYYQFTQETAKPPPFICFFFPRRADFYADNVNYAHIEELDIELYTDNKDFALGEKLEAALEAHDLPYTVEETYLDSESMYMKTYITEVYINEQ